MVNRYVLQIADAQKALAASDIQKDHFEQIGNQVLYPLEGESSRAVAVLDHETLAAGDLAAVRSVVSIASGEGKPIYQGRPDLRPLLSAYSEMQAVTYTFQPLAAAAVADSAGRIAGAASNGNPLLSLLGVRGMAFGARQDDQVCMVSLGFQYNNRLASTIVASGFRFFAIFNAIPVGIPEKLGSPESVDVHQDQGLAMVTAYFSAEKCKTLQKESGQTPAVHSQNDNVRSPLHRGRSTRTHSR